MIGVYELTTPMQIRLGFKTYYYPAGYKFEVLQVSQDGEEILLQSNSVAAWKRKNILTNFKKVKNNGKWCK